MKIKDGFVVREIADEFIVVPTGEMALQLNGLINETGYILWQKLSGETDEDALIQAMMDEYEVDRVTAGADISEFLDVLRKCDILE